MAKTRDVSAPQHLEPPPPRTMPSGLKGALLGFGNPLLDISAGEWWR